jgi:hypothetical protein
MVDTLEEILNVNRILIIFSRSKGWVLCVSSKVTLLFMLHTLDNTWVLCVNVEALGWLYFVLGDHDGWHLGCEAASVLAFGDRPILMASNKHIRSVEISTCMTTLSLSYSRFRKLLTVIITMLIVSAVPHSLLFLYHL